VLAKPEIADRDQVNVCSTLASLAQ
jgi:hypothetical protein